MIGAVPARKAEPGLPPLLREAALPLVLFSGVAHAGAAVLVGLTVVGAFSPVAGGALLPIWLVFSLFVSLAGYRWMEERRRYGAACSLAGSEICALASRVIALYPRPVDDPVIAEVFEMYRRAQASLEEGDHRGAGESVERGITLADEILTGDGETVRDEDGEAEAKGEGAW